MINIRNKHIHKFENRSCDFYLGRPSVLGNPFSWAEGTQAKFKVKNREESIKQYKKYIKKEIENKNPEICGTLNAIYREAKNGDVNLFCWCWPQDCHCNVVKEIIEEKL